MTNDPVADDGDREGTSEQADEPTLPPRVGETEDAFLRRIIRFGLEKGIFA